MTRALALAAAFLGAAGLAAAASKAPGRFVPTADKTHPRIKYADSLTSINDRCAVKESPLALEIRPVYVNAKPIGFCCTTCPAIFVQGPEPYLQRMKAALVDPVDGKRAAKVESRLRYHVNWEIYFFADRASMDAFRKAPLRYCGLLTDPVSGVRFRPTDASPKAFHAGRPFYFASDSTRAAFMAAPQGHMYRKGA